MPNEKLKKVYSYLQSQNKDFKVDYGTFESDMNDPEKLKKVHSYLSQVNKDFKVDYETFESDMGVKKKEPIVSTESGDTLQKEPSSEPSIGDYATSALSGLNRGFYGIAPDLIDFVSLGAKAINNYITAPLGLEAKVENIADTPSGMLAKSMREKLNELTPMAEGTEDAFSTQVGQGLGQVLGLVVSGGSGALTKGGIQATSTASTARAATEKLIEMATSRTSQIASAQMSVSGYNRAKQEGASEEDAFAQAFTSGLIGKTEAIPIGNAMSRLDKVTGGKFKSTLINGFKGGAEEFTQEAFQNYLENLSAQEIYDSKIPLMSGVLESGQVGGATGFIFNAFLTALGVSKRGAKGDKLRALESLESEVIAEKDKQTQDLEAVKQTILSKADAIDQQANAEQAINPETAAAPQDVPSQPGANQVLQDAGLGDTQVADGGEIVPADNRQLDLELNSEERNVIEQEGMNPEEFDSTRKFFSKPYQEQGLPNIGEGKGADFVQDENNAIEQTVNIQDLIPTQMVVEKSSIKSKEGQDNIPVILKNGDKLFVMDGHHRIAAESLAGKKQINAQIFDVTGLGLKTYEESGQETPEASATVTRSAETASTEQQVDASTIDVLSSSFDTVDETPMPKGDKFEGKSDYLAKSKGFTLSIKPTSKGYQVFLGKPGIDAGGVRTFGEIESWFPKNERELNAVILEAKGKMDELSESESTQLEAPVSEQGTEQTFVTHKKETVTGKKLTDALNKVADDMVKSYEKQRQEPYASHITESQKDEFLAKNLKYAQEVREGKHSNNFTIWQRINRELTGETVAFLPKEGTTNTPPPIEGEGGSTEQEGKKERKVAERYLSDPDVSDEVKSGLSEKGRFYIPTTNVSRQADADAIIEAKGVDESIKMIASPDNGIPESTRVFIGKTLYKQLKSDVKAAETDSDKDAIRDKINKLVEDVAQLGTKAGQTVQAFSHMFTSDVEQVAHSLRRQLEHSNKNALKNEEGRIDMLNQAIAQATDEAIRNLKNDPRIKSLLLESRKAQSVKVSKRKAFTKSLLDKLDALEKEVDDTSGKVFDATYRLGVVLYKQAINIIRLAVKGGDSLADAVESAISNMSQNVKDWDADGFRRQFDSDIKQEEKADRRTLAEVLSEEGDDFTSLAMEHYTKYSAKKQSISEKLQERFNMEEGEAKRLGKTLDKIVSDKRKSLIEQRFGEKNKTAKEKKVAKNLAQKIADLTNLGGLSDAQTRKAYAQSVGLDGMTDEQSREMQRLVEVAESKPEGFSRYQAIQDMVKYHQRVNGYSWTEVVESIWYANMLSGISTQALNFQANSAQILGETFVSVIQAAVEYKNPATAMRNLSYMLGGLSKGFKKGLQESATVLKDGYTPLKAQKFDKNNNLSGVRTSESDVLELMSNKNPLSYWKYVGRLMAATDIMFYGGLKGMRARQLAFRDAYNKNQNTYTKSMLAEANRIIGNNDIALEQAKMQAQQEGFKGRDFNRRVNEIIDQQTPEYIREDSNDFAAHGTFNYDPEGILGVMTSTINTATTRLPLLKVIVPFTRVISNVTNSYLDWTPWGLARVAKGGMGIPNKPSYKKFTQEEKLRELIKATAGTMAMATIYALSQPGDDGEEPLIEVTADGTGVLQKNYELGETGWKEYTFKIKGSDLRFEYRNIPSISIPFAIIGYLNDSKKYKGKDVTNDQLGLIFSGTLNYISDMSFLSGMSDFFQILSDKNFGSISDKLTAFGLRTAKTLVVPNLFTQTSRSIQEILDSPMKKANNFYGQIARDIPILRDGLGNLYNSLGEPIVTEQLYKFNPIGTRITTESDENKKDSYKLWEMISETGAYIGAPSKRVKVYDPKLGYMRELEDEEYQEYALICANETKRQLLSAYETIMAQENDEIKKKIISQIKESVRASAKAEFLK